MAHDCEAARMSSPPDTALSAYVTAAADLLALPLDDEQRANVGANVARTAAFAADLATIPLGNEIEIAGCA